MKRNIVLWFLTLFFIGGLVSYWFQIGGWGNSSIRDTFYLLSAFLGVIGGVFSLTEYGEGERAKTIQYLTLGIGMLFIGESFFTYYQHINIDPFPSIADVFYISAYPLIFLGLLHEIQIADINWQKMRVEVKFLLALVAILFAIIVFYFGVYQAYDVAEGLLTNIIAIGYGIGDLILIITDVLILILAWEVKGGRLFRSWIALFISLILMLVADILFAIYTQPYKEQIWFFKSLLDSIWMASYLLFALALFEFGFSLRSIRDRLSHLTKKS